MTVQLVMVQTFGRSRIGLFPGMLGKLCSLGKSSMRLPIPLLLLLVGAVVLRSAEVEALKCYCDSKECDFIRPSDCPGKGIIIKDPCKWVVHANCRSSGPLTRQVGPRRRLSVEFQNNLPIPGAVMFVLKPRARPVGDQEIFPEFARRLSTASPNCQSLSRAFVQVRLSIHFIKAQFNQPLPLCMSLQIYTA